MEKGRSTTCEKVRNYIPHDLALCILSKLPPKSLKRFGCVSKSWSLLFDNHHFMNLFRNNFISYHHSYYDDTFLILHSTNTDFYSLSGDDFEDIVKLNLPNPLQDEDYFFVLDSGSITGILCFYKTDDETTVFWNPTTDEFKIIPPSPICLEAPRNLVILVAYGYDKVRDDYKLIRYVCCRDDSFWEIYSLRSNTWTKHDFFNTHSLRFSPYSIHGKRVYINDMCHWQHLTEGAGTTCDLISFDFVNEVFFTTPIPVNRYSRLLYITGLNGSIAFISWIWKDRTMFDISILGEVGAKESWIKLYSIGPFSCNIEEPIGAGNNGDIFFREEDGNIVWYNLHTQMMEDLCIKADRYGHVLICKNSLLPIGGVDY